MKVIISESQYDRLLMELQEDNYQQISNYVTRAVRKKFPIVTEINIIPFKRYGVNLIELRIFVNEQLERGETRRFRTNSFESTELAIRDYTVKILRNFFGIEPYLITFDSEDFKYEGGNYIIRL